MEYPHILIADIPHHSSFLLRFSQNTNHPPFAIHSARARGQLQIRLLALVKKGVTLAIRAVGLQNYDVHKFLLFVQYWNLINAHKSFVCTTAHFHERKEKGNEGRKKQLSSGFGCLRGKRHLRQCFMASACFVSCIQDSDIERKEKGRLQHHTVTLNLIRAQTFKHNYCTLPEFRTEFL